MARKEDTTGHSATAGSTTTVRPTRGPDRRNQQPRHPGPAGHHSQPRSGRHQVDQPTPHHPSTDDTTAGKTEETSPPNRHRATTARNRPAGGVLTEADKATIRAAVLALPPLTDEQIDGICEVITVARHRWQREDHHRKTTQ
jgi:hypothetical protein